VVAQPSDVMTEWVDTALLLKGYLCISNGNINFPFKEDTVDNSNSVVIVKKNNILVTPWRNIEDSIDMAPLILNLGVRLR
jgi:hypothetical protein